MANNQDVPWLGIDLATLWFAGQHSIHWTSPARVITHWLYGHLVMFMRGTTIMGQWYSGMCIVIIAQVITKLCHCVFPLLTFRIRNWVVHTIFLSLYLAVIDIKEIWMWHQKKSTVILQKEIKTKGAEKFLFIYVSSFADWYTGCRIPISDKLPLYYLQWSGKNCHIAISDSFRFSKWSTWGNTNFYLYLAILVIKMTSRGSTVMMSFYTPLWWTALR